MCVPISMFLKKFLLSLIDQFGETVFATYEEVEKRAIELEESEPKWYEY